MKRSRGFDEDHGQFSAGDQDFTFEPVSKIIGVDIHSLHLESSPGIRCSLPGHHPGLSFVSYDDYEAHYNKAHTNRCLNCGKKFPSSHILELHIREFHDALNELRKEKGEPVYACFVETCNEKCLDPTQRRRHLVESHNYPSNYFFAVTKIGIDYCRSMLVEHKHGKFHFNRYRRQGHKARSNPEKNVAAHRNDDGRADRSNKDVEIYVDSGEGTSCDAEISGAVPATEPKESGAGQETVVVDTGMEYLAGAMSSLRFVPRTVWLGPKRKAENAPS